MQCYFDPCRKWWWEHRIFPIKFREFCKWCEIFRRICAVNMTRRTFYQLINRPFLIVDQTSKTKNKINQARKLSVHNRICVISTWWSSSLLFSKYHFDMTQPSNQDKFQLIKTVYLTNWSYNHIIILKFA